MFFSPQKSTGFLTFPALCSAPCVHVTFHYFSSFAFWLRRCWEEEVNNLFLTALPMECPIVFFFLLVLLRSPERQNLNRKKTPFVKHLIEPGGTSFIPLVKLSRRFGENQKNITTADKFLLSIYLQRLCTCQSSISRSFKLLEGLCRFDVGQAN